MYPEFYDHLTDDYPGEYPAKEVGLEQALQDAQKRELIVSYPHARLEGNWEQILDKLNGTKYVE